MKGTAKNKRGKIEKNAKIKEGECIFPFKYKWATHDKCFETEKGDICATEINPSTRTLIKYGYCEEDEEPKRKSSSLKISSIKRPKLKTLKKRILILVDSPTPSPVKVVSEKKEIKKKKSKKYKLILEEEGEKKVKRKKKTKKLILIEPEISDLKISPQIIEKEMSPKEVVMKPKAYNDEFIEILGELKDIMQAQGEVFRAKAYQTAQETIMMYEGDITDPNQLKGLKGIGETILLKLNEYVNTGALRALEKGRKDPVILLTKVYGIGPKKAKELIEQGIKTIEELRENNQLLNDVQKIGLEYYEDILEKIPRSEIDEYKTTFDYVMNGLNINGSRYEIVGSYRRQKQVSGDIDVIITNDKDNKKIFDKFIDALKERGILIELLTRGKTKSLTIAKLPGKTARRIDFLYTSPEEYPFAILYFTGSKAFNTVMRQRALDRGYTLNEHGISVMKKGVKGIKGVKGEKVLDGFTDEKSIFDFFEMEYKLPEERIDGRAVENKKINLTINEMEKSKENKSNVSKEEEQAFQEQLIKEKADEEQMESNVVLGKKNVTLKRKKTNVRDLLKKFKGEGISALKILSESELSEMIIFANNAYYCKGKPVMTDNQYDILREYTLEVYPNNETAKEGHAGCEMEFSRNKVNLPYEMWSMDKIKPDTNELERWTGEYKGPYVLSCKLDGVSGLYVTEGNTPKLYTRGDGIIGQDISHLIPYLRLPKNKGLAIRGEFIISKAKFSEKFADKFANPRNFVAGIINKKRVNPTTLANISFVSYEVIKPELVPSAQLKYLEELDIEVAKYSVVNTVSNELLSTELLKWRNEYEYEIDGLICMDNKIYPRISGNPTHAFAFKMVLSDQVAEAKVIDVLWSPSKDGLLKPRVQIDPIVLGGVRIEFATGFNAKFIVDNSIGVGAVIQLVRSGDVIPHILAVTVKADSPLMPNADYEWNETRVDIVLANKEDNVIVKEKLIEAFFNKIGVDKLKVGKIKKLVSAGYDNVVMIIKMNASDFEDIEGFGKKSSALLVTSIREKLNDAPLTTLMAATNFARGMGRRKLEPIFEAYPDILTSKMADSEKIKLIQNVKGVAENSATRFVENIDDFLNFLKEAGLEGKLGETQQVQKKAVAEEGHPLFGKKIVMTGFRDKNLENKIISVGGQMASSVSKNVFIVLTKDLDETTGKAQKARDLNIPLMTPEDFKEKYGL